ncbi:MAG TPA: type II toxin-antitoxin system RelE/ParE family toxin, partial [Gammaproteobacteria bacterium]|nr:type II toxin-antitoxin system RelE/ParE family toxin [Gammaproteobacteria bacterium]
SFHPEAEAEFNEAIDYYEECEPGLGYDFSIEVFDAIRNIVRYPAAWPVVGEDVRRCLVDRFPFGIIHSVEQNGIFILATMHLRRHPDYWKDRH